jgi:hypothetical protein
MESEVRADIEMPREPMRLGKAVCKRAGTRQRNRREEGKSETHRDGLMRHSSVSAGIMTAITRRVSRVASGHNSSSVVAVLLMSSVFSALWIYSIPAALRTSRVAIRICNSTVHIPTTGLSSVVPRRVIRASESMSATPRRPGVLFGISSAIGNVELGRVRFFVVKAHLEVCWSCRKWKAQTKTVGESGMSN